MRVIRPYGGRIADLQGAVVANLRVHRSVVQAVERDAFAPTSRPPAAALALAKATASAARWQRLVCGQREVGGVDEAALPDRRGNRGRQGRGGDRGADRSAQAHVDAGGVGAVLPALFASTSTIRATSIRASSPIVAETRVVDHGVGHRAAGSEAEPALGGERGGDGGVAGVGELHGVRRRCRPRPGRWPPRCRCWRSRRPLDRAAGHRGAGRDQADADAGGSRASSLRVSSAAMFHRVRAFDGDLVAEAGMDIARGADQRHGSVDRDDAAGAGERGHDRHPRRARRSGSRCRRRRHAGCCPG